MPKLDLTPQLNGHPPAPPHTGGAFVAARQRTVFPVDVLPFSGATLLYTLQRVEVMGIKLWRFVQWALVLVAALWAGGLPGRWWVTGLLLISLLALQGTLIRARRRNFVWFEPQALAALEPMALPTSEKLPVFVTGRFQVQNKQQRFTWAPGFYRTFATREHALLCQVTAQPAIPIGRWPEAEVGLWYIFFTPSALQAIGIGALRFGRRELPALVVTYLPPLTPTAKPRRGQNHPETIYIAFQQPAHGSQILADLLYDRPDLAPALTHAR